MTRVKKEPKERRAEFMDCAEALFFSRGYEATTVNDIIVRAGLSKGAFYHYFESKEALLDALAERVAAQVVADAEDVLDDPDLDALARLNAFLAQGRQWKIERMPRLRAVFAVIMKAENVVLYQSIIAASGRVLVPVLTGIVEEGVREGVFDPPAPGLVAEMLLQLANARQGIMLDAMAMAERGDLLAATQRLETRLTDETAVIERLLGVPRGAVTLVEPGFVRALLAAMV